TPVLGKWAAGAIATPTVLSLPGIAGFLVWEFKENFRLYRQNRAHALAPVVFGHHGETMSALMRPGIHSGTLPKLFAKLRRAAAKGESDPDRAAKSEASALETLHEVSTAVRRFVDRELGATLARSPAWNLGAVSANRVDLSANRVRVA